MWPSGFKVIIIIIIIIIWIDLTRELKSISWPADLLDAEPLAINKSHV